MKDCAACLRNMPKECFSKNQWQLTREKRRCKECISANRFPAHSKAPSKLAQHAHLASSASNDDGGGKRPAAPSDEDAVSCWICLEREDESDQSLRRDCSCRGNSGFVHLQCIVKFAQHETKRCNITKKIKNCRDAFELRKPWEVCRNCSQLYQNSLAYDLASEFADFVERNYPKRYSWNLEALFVKLETYTKMSDGSEGNEHMNIAIRMLSTIAAAKMKAHAPMSRLFNIEAHVYNNLGIVSMRKGTKGDMRDAVMYFKTYLAISEGNRLTDNIVNARSNLAMAKARLNGNCSSTKRKGEVKGCRMLYRTAIRWHGEDSIDAMKMGMGYATALSKACRAIEAERLLTKLAALSCRAHGPDHTVSRQVSMSLQRRKERNVAVVGYCGVPILSKALRYVEGDMDRCILQAEHRFVVVESRALVFAPGTPVVCYGLEGPGSNLNGKIGDVRSVGEAASYEVHFEEKGIVPRSVGRKNLRILFELPEKVPDEGSSEEESSSSSEEESSSSNEEESSSSSEDTGGSKEESDSISEGESSTESNNENDPEDVDEVELMMGRDQAWM